MKPVNEKQFQNVVALPAPERFEHFIKVVVGNELAWGLWDDGWAMMEDGAGHAVFPVWPAREYADVYRTGDWSKYVPKEIPLLDLLDRLPLQFRVREEMLRYE